MRRKTFLFIVAMGLILASCAGNGDSSSFSSEESSSIPSSLESLPSSTEASSQESAETSNPQSLGESSEGSSAEGIAATAINLARSIPSTVTYGESIDFSAYITVLPSGAQYEIVDLAEGESNVKIEGTTITGIGVGEFKVQVKALYSNIVKNIEGTVISKEREAIGELIDSLSSFKTEVKYNGETYYTYYYSSSYCYSTYLGYGKLTLSDGYDYQVTDEDGDLLPDTVSPGPYNFDEYIWNYGFPYASDNLIDEVSDSGEVTVTLNEPATASFSRDGYCLGGVALGFAENYAITLDDLDNPTTMTLTPLGERNGYSYVFTELNSMKIETMEDCLSAGTIPERIEATAFDAMINSLNEAKNGTIEFQSHWINSSGFSIAQPEGASDYYFNTYQTSVYLSDSAMYASSESGGVAGGYAVKEGEEYYTSFSSTDEGLTWQETTSTIPSSDGLYAYTGYSDFDEDFLSSLIFSSSSYYDSYQMNLYSLLMRSTSNLVPGYYTDCNPLVYGLLVNHWSFYGGEGSYGDLLSAYFTEAGYCDIYAYDSGSTEVRFYIPWSSSAYYFMIVTFSDIGTTTVPTPFIG